MTTIIKLKKMICLMVLAVMAVGVYASPGFGAWATEATQLANFGKLVLQLEQLEQIVNIDGDMLIDMLKNTKSLLKLGKLNDLLKPVQDALNMYKKFQELLGKMSKFDEDLFNECYSASKSKGYGHSTKDSIWTYNFSEAHFEMSKKLDEKMEKTMEYINEQIEDIKKSGESLNTVAEKSSDLEERNAIMNATNDLLVFMGGELIKMREVWTNQFQASQTHLDIMRREADAAAAFIAGQKWEPR